MDDDVWVLEYVLNWSANNTQLYIPIYIYIYIYIYMLSKSDLNLCQRNSITLRGIIISIEKIWTCRKTIQKERENNIFHKFSTIKYIFMNHELL